MDDFPAIRFGQEIRIRHVSTQAFLRSSGKIFGHPGSSRQQLVVAGKEVDDASVWIVKPRHGWSVSGPAVLNHGDVVRLEHSATHANLHSHVAPAPLNRGQQEVTCYGSDGIGDENDNWRIELESGGLWTIRSTFRLVHISTGKSLHSHSSSDPVLTDGYQEVTGYDGRDANDLWLAVPADAEAPHEQLTLPRHDDMFEAPWPLVRAVADGECILYGGAGLSVGSGVPTRQQLVAELLADASELNWFDESYLSALRGSLAAGDTALVADALQSKGEIDEAKGGVGFTELVHRYRDRLANADYRLSPVHSLLRAIPFHAALTTNYDRLLEMAFGNVRAFLPDESDALLEALNQREFFVLHLHGMLDRGDSIVLSPGGYGDLIGENRLLAKAIENLVVSRTFLFLGTSLDEIGEFFSELRPSISERKHFAVVPVTDDRWRVRADILKRRYNVNVIPRDPVYTDHELPVFLRDLSRKVSQRSSPANLVPPKKSRLFLKRITLQNIGPYDELTLDLNHGWNVLLGDNGVGKSSIIRAIAVGFIGREAGEAAIRLIKQGHSHARIEIETDERRYVTELFKSDGPVEILSKASPLAAEGWLALGFPALRALRWTPSLSGDFSPRRRPVANDLLPLLENEPDPRQDDFKKWLVNSGIVGANWTILTKLNEILRSLTPGLELSISDVDATSGHVFVSSEQARLRIESVSQGTASILGWIGVLLQRQTEIHGMSEDVFNLPAFLIIDEVDAHMHPAWQRSLIPTMVKLFPQLQVLATTHSSLIVSSLAPEQVTVLRRGPDGLCKLRPTTDLQGLRADQILTSEMFGLSDTVDPETQRLLERYADLLSLPQLDPDDEREFTEIAKLLRLRVPSPSQRKEAREAAELIRQFMVTRMQAKPTDEQERVMQQVRLQLNNALAGNGTPS